MDKVLRVTTRRELAAEGNADLRWWRSRSAAERLAAVETCAGNTWPTDSMLNRDFKEFVE